MNSHCIIDQPLERAEQCWSLIRKYFGIEEIIQHGFTEDENPYVIDLKHISGKQVVVSDGNGWNRLFTMLFSGLRMHPVGFDDLNRKIKFVSDVMTGNWLLGVVDDDWKDSDWNGNDIPSSRVMRLNVPVAFSIEELKLKLAAQGENAE